MQFHSFFVLYEFPLRHARGMEVVVLSKGGGRHSVLIAYSSHRRCLHYDSAPLPIGESSISAWRNLYYNDSVPSDI